MALFLFALLFKVVNSDHSLETDPLWSMCSMTNEQATPILLPICHDEPEPNTMRFAVFVLIHDEIYDKLE